MNVKCVPNDLSGMYTQPKQANRPNKQKTKTTDYDKLLNKPFIGKLSQDYEMYAVGFRHVTGGCARIKE